jgi:hypothetical protein
MNDATWGTCAAVQNRTQVFGNILLIQPENTMNRHSGLDPESSSKPANSMFRTLPDTGFCRYDVYYCLRAGSK